MVTVKAHMVQIQCTQIDESTTLTCFFPLVFPQMVKENITCASRSVYLPWPYLPTLRESVK